MLQEIVKAIPPELWQQAVRQTYVNSLISWMGLIPVVAFLCVLYWSWNKDGDELATILPTIITGMFAFIGLVIWASQGFNFLNPEYKTYAKLVYGIANLF